MGSTHPQPKPPIDVPARLGPRDVFRVGAAGLRAHALANAGDREKAGALFADVTQTSTLSETQYNYACFLAADGRAAEARDWAERILRKKATMPEYIRRRERPWFRRAKALIKRRFANKETLALSLVWNRYDHLGMMVKLIDLSPIRVTEVIIVKAHLNLLADLPEDSAVRCFTGVENQRSCGRWDRRLALQQAVPG